MKTVVLVAGTLVVTLFGVAAELFEGTHGVGVTVGAYAAGAVAAVSVGWCRRAPLAVGVVVVLASLAYHLIGVPGLSPAVAMFPVVYLLAESGVRWRLALAAALILAVAVIPLPSSASLGALAGPEVLMVAVAAFGESARTRRVAAEEALRAVRVTAAEQERRRLAEDRLVVAREVHDVVAHTLSVITVQAAAAADALADRPADSRTALGEVRRAARDATAELRGTLSLLRQDTATPAAPAPGLAELPDLVDRARSVGLDVTLRAAEGPWPPDLELAVYRIVQEALTNTLRHAGPTAAAVVVEHRGGRLTVEVTDDGVTDAAVDRSELAALAAGSGAHGLAGMRERVRALGGDLEAGPVEAGGFRVAARLPTRGERSGSA